MAEHADAGGTDPDLAYTLPRETTPAWESELLLSIGLVVAMLQLSPVLDGYFTWWEARLSERWFTPMLYAFLYLKAAVIALILTFVTHLSARGFWVALVGVRAVFPGGIDWSRLRMGRVALSLAKRRSGDVGAGIERIDNFASMAFAMGFAMVSLTISALLPILLAALLAAIASAVITATSKVNDPFWWLFLVALGLLVLPTLLASALEVSVGRRLPPGHRMERIIALGLRSGAPWFNHFWSEPIILTLSSRLGQARFMLILNSLMILVIGIAATQLVSMRLEQGLLHARQPPIASNAYSLRPAHYSDTRAALDTAPFISSEVVSERFLRVFIPFRPRIDEARFKQHCPELDQGSLDSNQTEATKTWGRCAAKVYAVALNGVPVPETQYMLAQDSLSQYRGFVLRLDLAGLPAGKQVLSLNSHRSDQDSEKAPSDQAKHPQNAIVIPFWRDV